jgi:hypothetical protein
VVGRRRFVNGCQVHRSSSSDFIEGVAPGQDLRDLDQGPAVFRSDRLYNQERVVIPRLQGGAEGRRGRRRWPAIRGCLARDDGISRHNVRPAHLCLVYLPNSLTRFVFSTSCHLWKSFIAPSKTFQCWRGSQSSWCLSRNVRELRLPTPLRYR